jgi:chemotaxis protein CheD
MSITTPAKPVLRQRHQDMPTMVAGDFYDTSWTRYYDQVAELNVIKVISGQYAISDQPQDMMMTILGSCISACMRDPVASVGGMNHFLLPTGESALLGNDTRYGAFAMEQLLNGLLNKGAVKHRLEVKIFGGGKVLRDLSDPVGERNIRFIKDFLHSEGLTLSAEDVGGDMPRRIHYYPVSGKVRLRRLKRLEDQAVTHHEINYLTSLQSAPVEGDVELFS